MADDSMASDDADQLLLAESLISLSLASGHEPRPAPSPPPRTAVLFQPACTLHRYIRTTDDSTIVERPHRIRAVKLGVAAAWARLDLANSDDDLDQLLDGLTLGGGTGRSKATRGVDFKGKGRARQVIGAPFDILDSDAQLPVDHAALRYVHPKPNQPPDNDDGGWESASDSSSAGADADSGPSSTSATDPKPSASPPWPEQLQSLCRASSSSLDSPSPSAATTTSPHKSSRTTSEIPPHLPQGDLYLCPGSEPAIFGALGACCEAVDRIVAGGGRVAAQQQQQQQQTANVSADQQDAAAATSYDRAFVAIRPPGHHCGEANPQGFCFVNNVAVAAAHAHIEHGIDRVVIFDIDLHHGNGTQEIAWRFNAEAHGILEEQQRRSAAAAALKTPRSSPRKISPRKLPGGVPTQKGVKEEEEEEKEAKQKDPLRIMYASLHDIWSYPCEDGDPTLVAAASLSLNGGHGQYISNVHLEPWDSEVDFHERLYPKYREGLIERAEDFVRLMRRGVEESEEEATRKTLVIVSLGCDASEHESGGMSRHNRNVPTSFYRRFALDATSFAHHHAAGKCLAVLEGGYSDRALASASAAFLSGFAERVPSSSGNERDGAGDRKVADRFTANQERDGWWSEPHLKKLEKACSVAKPRRGGAHSSSSTMTGLLVGADSGAAIRDPWLARAVEIFAHLEDTAVASSVISSLAPGSSGSTLHSAVDPNTPRQLRDRTKSRSINYAALADGSSPLPSPVRGALTSTRPPSSSSSNRLRGDAASSFETSTPSSSSLPPPVPILPPAFASASDEAPSYASSSDPRAAAHPVFAFTSPDSDPPTPESSVTAPSLPTAATPEATFTAAAGHSADPSAETAAPVKPAIRFTWKQGGFGSEPRM